MKFSMPNDESMSEFEKVPVFFLKPGITQFKVLPPHEKSNGAWARELLEHNYTTKDGKFGVTTCLKGVNEFCPICDFAKDTYEKGDDASVEYAKSLRPRSTFMINALVQSAPPGVEFVPGKVYVIKLPKTVFRTLRTFDRDMQAGFDDITGARHSSEGQGLLSVTFRVTRQGQKLATTYTVTPLAKRTRLEDDFKLCGIEPSTVDLLDLSELYKPRTDLETLLPLLGVASSNPFQGQVPIAPPLTGGLTRPTDGATLRVEVPAFPSE